MKPTMLALLNAVCTLIFLSSVAAWPSPAKTLTVTNTNDSGTGSLRNAIASASSGDTISFLLRSYPATITLSSVLSIDTSLTISGPGAASLAVSGNHAVQVFQVAEGTNVSIAGITVEYGSSATDGGGIQNYGTLTVSKSTLLGNSASSCGGGIANEDSDHGGTLIVRDSILSNNSAGCGGGIWNALYYTSLTVSGTTLSGNTATGCVGGIVINGTGSITDSSLSGNSVSSLSGCSLSSNAIYIFGSAILTNVSVSANLGSGSSSIEAYGSVSIINSIVSGNSGSGIVVDPNQYLIVSNSTISGNASDGISQSQGWLSVSDSTISGNGGSGITNIDSALVMTNSTVAGNGGWGIVNTEFDVSVDYEYIYNSTLSQNAGGIYSSYSYSNPIQLKNTIVANSGSLGNCYTGSESFPSSGGYNLSDDATCSGFLTAMGDLNSTPAGLDPGGLRNNGGPTQTIALIPGGLAVNAIPVSNCTAIDGLPIGTDQRGIPRPEGGACDIGAYEYALTSSAPVSGAACDGVYNGTFSGNIDLSAGQQCVFLNGAVTGNVQQDGGNLVLLESQVGGNVQVNGNSTFTISPYSTISGNLEIQNLPTGSGQNQLCGSTVKGNLQFQDNGTAVLFGAVPPTATYAYPIEVGPICVGNIIGGNLQVQDNSASTSVVGNTVGGNLTDQNNAGPTEVLNDTVSGNLQVQNDTGSTSIEDDAVGGNPTDQNNAGPTQIFSNTVSGNLQCNNDTAIQGGGNVVGGSKQGQCLGF